MKVSKITIFVITIASFLVLYGVNVFISRKDFNGIRALFGLNIGWLGVALVHMIIFGLFVLSFQLQFRSGWLNKGLFLAFIVSLFSEMFGLPLFVYLVSNFFYKNYPFFINRHAGGKRFFSPLVFGDHSNYGIYRTVGSVIVVASLFLIFISWHQLYKGRNILMRSGIYAKIRHPQYLGFMGFTLGWLIVWPTVIGLIIWPILVISYIRQSLKEEKYLANKYGDDFLEYKAKTGFFSPLRLSLKKKR